MTANPSTGAPWKLLLVVNPMAAGVTKKRRRAVEEALAGFDVTVAETVERDHATDLARQAATDGMGAVIVLGGDGTLNEAANGLIGTDTALAALPGGSTSVYARTVGMSRRPARATAQLIEALAANSVRQVSVGSVNGRWFLFHLGVGYDAAVVCQVERYAAMKSKVGQAVFVYAALTTWFKHYDRSRPRFSIEFDDGETLPDGYFLICLNTNPYTYLGPLPFNVAPEATGETGLAAVTLRSLRVGTVLGVTTRALVGRRRVADHAEVDFRTERRSMTVVGKGAIPYQVDGDYLGESDRLAVRHHPDALRLIVPVDSPVGHEATAPAPASTS